MQWVRDVTFADAGYTVVEAARMNARANRGIGKSDPLDARRIAAAALPLHDTELREPRADDGIRAAVRVLCDLGIDARRALAARQITTIAAWRARDEDIATSTARGEAIRLAQRVVTLDSELKEISKRIIDLVTLTAALRQPHPTDRCTLNPEEPFSLDQDS